MKRGATILWVMILFLMFGVVWGEDVNPPPWSRTDPGATYQQWEFGTDDNPVGPDVWTNAAGDPLVSITGGFAENTVWYENYQGASGVWGFEIEMIATIPNFDNLNPLKEIQVQMTFFADGVANLFVLPEGDEGKYAVMDQGATTDLGGGWFQATFSTAIEPNPTFEEIWIRPAECTLYVDELVVDTICIPEPATLLLLGLGGLALLRRRR